MESPFPRNSDEFDADERISYSKLDGRFIAVHDDGTEFEFDPDLREWIPTGDDEPLNAEEYGGEAAADGSGTSQKRKLDDAKAASENGEAAKVAKKSKGKKAKAPPKPKENCAVYVTGLPLDATVNEIKDLFSRKCGIIAEEIDSGAPRIKLYTDEAGKFKGDALIVFFKPQSVRMALMLLDDSDFRVLANGKGEGRIRVQEADSNYKRVRYDAESGASTPDGGGAQSAQRKSQAELSRQKVIKRTQKLDARLADWSDDEDERIAPPEPSKPKPKYKQVILRQMFRIFELEEDPASILEIKEDIREECAKLGTVTSVVLYDREPEGIVTVRFKEPEAAERCVALMNGRKFDARTVVAEFGTGRERFRMNDKAKEEFDSD